MKNLLLFVVLGTSFVWAAADTQASVTETQQYATEETQVDQELTLNRATINGPADAPKNHIRLIVDKNDVAEIDSVKLLSNVAFPTFGWSLSASANSDTGSVDSAIENDNEESEIAEKGLVNRSIVLLGTVIYTLDSADKLTADQMLKDGIGDEDGAYYLKLFFENRGHRVTELYTQKIDTQNSGGFSFAEYKAEIDAGFPVLIHLEDSTVIGTGYDSADKKIYLQDSWDRNTHSMDWGESYAGMEQYAVTVIHTEAAEKEKVSQNDTKITGDPIKGSETILRNSVKDNIDYNGDGVTDILWSYTSGLHDIWYIGLEGRHIGTRWVGARGYVAVGEVDMDGDGITDIIWRRPDGNYNAWKMSRWGYVRTWWLGRRGYTLESAGDFNGDGYGDLLWRRPDGYHNIMLAYKGIRWVGAYGYRAKPVNSVNFWGTAGTADILWRRPDGYHNIWTMNTNGQRQYTWWLGYRGYTVEQSADFDSSNRGDILWRRPDGYHNILMNPLSSPEYTKWVGAYGYRASMANVFEIHLPSGPPGTYDDILWKRPDGHHVFWLHQANGSFKGVFLR